MTFVSYRFQVFTLNTDATEIVTNVFPYSVVSDYIVLRIVSPSASDVGLRMELIGCVLDSDELSKL